VVDAALQHDVAAEHGGVRSGEIQPELAVVEADDLDAASLQFR
jgi:hypothetical protein